MKDRVFYTDGACSGNPGKGGWACVEVLRCPNGITTQIMSGAKDNATNNEMELYAVCKALVKAYKDGCTAVTIYCDSAYVVNAIQKNWLMNWGRNGWQTKEGKPVKNDELWKKVYKLIYEKRIIVNMVQVKGHNGDILNELADKEAVKARESLD